MKLKTETPKSLGVFVNSNNKEKKFMKVKDQQPYILDNEQEDKNHNNKIIIFTTILIFTLTIILSVIIQTNKNR
jgi:hypothetical protein